MIFTKNFSFLKASLFLAILFILSNVFATFPDISSNSGVLINAKTGQMLFEKNADEKLFPASTTKLLTAILVLENCNNLNEKVVASNFAVMSVEAGSSAIAIQPGEEFTVEQLLYALLVESANDAANTLAEFIGGSIPEFVDMMNKKAEELGCTNSHFANANGLHNIEHYTTARDMAKIAFYSVNFDKADKLKEITKTRFMKLDPTNKISTPRYLISTNALITPPDKTQGSLSYYYEPAYGLKTGYTSQAGHAFVGGAERNNIDLISVVLKAPSLDARFSDSINLFKYAFENYSNTFIIDSNNFSYLAKLPSENDLIVNSTLSGNYFGLVDPSNPIKLEYSTEVKVNENVKLPILKGQIIGKVSFKFNNSINSNYTEFDLVSLQNIPLPFYRTTTFKVIVVLIIVVMLIFLFLLILARIKVKKRMVLREKIKKKYRETYDIYKNNF